MNSSKSMLLLPSSSNTLKIKDLIMNRLRLNIYQSFADLICSSYAKPANPHSTSTNNVIASPPNLIGDPNMRLEIFLFWPEERFSDVRFGILLRLKEINKIISAHFSFWMRLEKLLVLITDLFLIYIQFKLQSFIQRFGFRGLAIFARFDFITFTGLTFHADLTVVIF